MKPFSNALAYPNDKVDLISENNTSSKSLRKIPASRRQPGFQ